MDQSTESVFSSLSVLVILIILPNLGEFAMVAGCAAMMTAYVYLIPDRFRSRNGSLIPAVCLVSSMWLMAGVVGVLSLTGGI